MKLVKRVKNPYSNSPFFKALNEERKGGEVFEYIKSEPKKKRKHAVMPESRIKARPDLDSMSPVYETIDGKYLYTVDVYSFKRPEVRAAFILPSIFYGISRYDGETGRLLEVTYEHTNKKVAEERLKSAIQTVNSDKAAIYFKEKAHKDEYHCYIQLCKDQYKLYDLRVMYGYR